jgi:two-component sensor histidine kinase
LDYSRLEAGRAALHLESIDVAEVVNSVATEHGDEIKDKSIELRVEIARDFGAVTTDKYKLSQVISNLVGNAIKFTSIGAITIAAGELDAERWYMEVRDTGIGMSHEALTYIFDEFRQVDDRLARSYGGTGLGLAITRRIVELLEGEITVESKPEEGSCFRITCRALCDSARAQARLSKKRARTGSVSHRSLARHLSLARTPRYALNFRRCRTFHFNAARKSAMSYTQQSDDKVAVDASRRTIFIVVGLATLLILGGIIYLMSRPDTGGTAAEGSD